MTRIVRILGLHLAVFAAVSSPQRHEVWAAYLLGGKRTGAYHEVEVVGPSGEIDTTIETTIVFNRLGSKLEIKGKTLYHEDSDGRILGFESDQTSSQQTTHVSGKAVAGALEISTTAGEKTYGSKVPFTGRLLGPEGARRLAVSSLHRVGEAVSYQTFIPEMASVATYTDKLVALGPITTGKAQVTGLRLEQTFNLMPGKSILCLDRDGWLLTQSTPSPFGDIVAVRSDGETKAVSGAVLPAETFTKSIVTSNIRLPNERLIDRLEIRIKAKKPDLGWPDFTAPNQRVISQTKDALILEITRPKVGSRPPRPEPTGPGLAGCMKPNALLQSDDSAVKAIVAKVVKPTDDAWSAVRALQKWTNNNMHFDLGIAIAPASEVAKNRSGTCFGYSMLLGSLVRAAGVPSRVRMGLVYAGGIWGGHAWVDVLIGHDWIPIDGALYGPGPADAARFSCYTSSMEENSVGGIGGLAQMFGNIGIDVLEYSVGGKRVVVPGHAAPYTVAGNVYCNPWLGFSVNKPNGFRFADANVVWPETTLVAMVGPRGLRVDVKDLSASLPTGGSNDGPFRENGVSGPITRVPVGLIAGSATRAAILIAGKGSQWLLVATGPGARRVLSQLAKSVVLRE